MALAISPQTLVKKLRGDLGLWQFCARAANGEMAGTRYADVVSGAFSAVLAVNATESARCKIENPIPDRNKSRGRRYPREKRETVE